MPFVAIAEKTLEITSSFPKEYSDKHIYDARVFLPVSMRSEKINTVPEENGKKNYWYLLDPASLFSDQENRENNRIWYAVNSCFSIVPLNDLIAEDEKYSIVPLIKNQIPAEIRMWSKTIKISTNYTKEYEKLPSFNATKKILEMISIWGYQWSLLGGEDLILYNGEIALAAYRRGYVFLYPQNWDYNVEKVYISNGKEI